MTRRDSRRDAVGGATAPGRRPAQPDRRRRAVTRRACGSPEARGYHPRGRTVGESAGSRPRRESLRQRRYGPSLRLVSDDGAQRQAHAVGVIRRVAPRPRAAGGAARHRRPDRPTHRRGADQRPPANPPPTAHRVAQGAGTRESRGARRCPPRRWPTRGGGCGSAWAIVLVLFAGDRRAAGPVPVHRRAGVRGPGPALAGCSRWTCPRRGATSSTGTARCWPAAPRPATCSPTRTWSRIRPGPPTRCRPCWACPRSELLPKLAPHRYAGRHRGPVRVSGPRCPGRRPATRVSALDLAGIGVRRDESRVVPGHDLAANLIGFTGRGHERPGWPGGQLRRGAARRRRRAEVRDRPAGRGGRPGSARSRAVHNEETPARPGSSLQLTIDRDLQYEVQRILGVTDGAGQGDRGRRRRARRAYRRGAGAGQLSVLRRGEPVRRQADWGDNATGLVVEPGSVHKANRLRRLPAGGCRASRTTRCWCRRRSQGRHDVQRHPCAFEAATAMTLPGILAWSSNVGTITLADKLGRAEAVRVPAGVRSGRRDR